MADWGLSDPDFDATKSKAVDTSWGESDPDYQGSVPTPISRREAFPEEPRSFTEALIGRGEPSRTSIGLGGAPLAESQQGLDETGLERATTAIGDIPEAAMRGYYGAKTGANILGVETGVLSPQEAAANIAASNKAAAAVPMPESVRKGMEELQKAKGWAESFEVLKKYPDILPSVVGESVSSSLLSGATGLIGGLTGAVIGSAAPVVGTAAGGTAGLSVGVGLGSAATEYASTLNNFLLERGYDTSNPDQLKAAFSDPDLMAEARKDAALRGVAVGAFDALSAGVAGKLFGPVSRLAGKRVGPIAGSTAELGAQAGAGAAGAATGQVLTEGKITEPSEILLEAAGEIVPGLGEIAISKMLPSGQAPAAAPAAPAAAPTEPLQVNVTVPMLRPGERPEGAAAEPEPSEKDLETLSDVAALRGAGFDVDDISSMSTRQRRAVADKIRKDGIVEPAELTPDEIQLFAPNVLAPAVPSSPEPAVEARGPEGLLPSPSAPPVAPVADAPSERAAALVQQGVEPLEAMQQAAQAPVEAPAPIEAPQATQPLLNIPYDTLTFDNAANRTVASSGNSQIINFSGRMIVVRDVDGVRVPFYLSTGDGGKKDVQSGKWYPFFGIGPDGWINKTGGAEMSGYYGSEALRNAAQQLDSEIGDIRNDKSVPKVKATGSHIDFINEGLSPVENQTPDTLARVRDNIDGLLARLGGSQVKPAPDRTEAGSAAVPKFSRESAKKQFDNAFTGKPFKATLIRGQGATESPYNDFGAQEPILGQGRYTTYDEEYASIFGPNITEHEVSLKNPLVIDNDLRWKNLTKKAGWKFPNPSMAEPGRAKQEIANLRKMLVDEGYDGVVILVPESEIDGKTLQNVFGADQAIEFNVAKPAVEKKAEPKAKAEPVAAAPKAKKGPSPRPFWRAGNMDTAIRNMGGIKDVGGEFKARDVPRQLINNKRGRPFEQVALDLIERGYYPEFKADLEASADSATGNYQPTPEMLEQIKNDVGKKKMHPSYQEDVEEARRLDQEKNIFGPYIEEAEKAAAALGISKDDPMVRQAAQMVYNGDVETAEDAFRALLFTEIEDALPAEALPELREAFGEENLRDIEEFLAIEGMAPLEADYVPEPSPVQEGRPVSGEIREQGKQPEGEGAPEVSRGKVAEPVGEKAERKSGPILKEVAAYYRNEGSLRAVPRPDGSQEIVSRDGSVKIAVVPKGKDIERAMLEAVRDEANRSFGDDPTKMTLDEFSIAYRMKLIPEFEITPDEMSKLLVTAPDGTFTVNIRGLYDKIMQSVEPDISRQAKEDIGAEGKPQLVIPGAEKVDQKKMLEKKAQAPLKAKVKQKEPGGLFSDERLQQDLFSSVASKPEPKPVVEQQPKRQIADWMKEYAASNGHKAVFANEKIGIAYRSTQNGILEYIAYHRPSNSKTMVDVDAYTGTMFTPDELQLLRDEKAKEEKWSANELSKNPAGPFKNANIVVSPNFPEKFAKIGIEWLKIAKIPPNTKVMFSTVEDAENMDLAGDYRIISSPKTFFNAGTNGLHVSPKENPKNTRTDQDWHVIYIKKGMKTAKTLETLSHEIGHLLDIVIWRNASGPEKDAVIQAHETWAKKSGAGFAPDLFSGRAYRTQRELLKKYPHMAQTPASNIGQKEYFLSFPEWYADNMARWFTSQNKPLTVVDRYFKRLADALRRFYAAITNQQYAPNPEFKKWFEGYLDSQPQFAAPNMVEIKTPETIAREQRDTLDRSPDPVYTVPQDGLGAQFMYSIVDRYYDATAIQRAIEAARGSKMPDNLDVEMAIQLMQDKAIAKQNKFFDDKVRPMVAFMQTHKITGDEAGMFLYAQHAPERNLRMAQRDPTRFDGTNGSGMTTQEAIDYMESIPEERRALLKQLYNDHVKPILRSDLDYRVENGLLTDEAYESYTLPFDQGGYDYYMPLQGFAEEDADASNSIPNVGRGFAVWGKEYKVAAGRVSKAMNPLFSAIQKRMDGIVRVEKNNTDKVIYDLFKKNPNPEVAEIYSEKNLPTRPVLRMDGTIQQVPDFAEARADYTLPLKIGGKQHYIVFNRDNPVSSRLVRVLKNLDKDSTDIISRTIFSLGQFMSKINTQWVPDFFITNMPRDVQDALVSLYSTKEGLATNFMAEFTRAGNIVRKVASGKTLSVDEQASYDEWTGSGGRLDFGGFATVAKSADKLEEEFGDVFNRERTTPEQLQRYFKKSGQVTLGAIEAFNQFFDDMVRFSVYRAARKGGMSRDRAAQLARRATVDFRQRGQIMPYVNAFYPYLSAGINGVRNLLRVLRTKKGKKIIGSLMLLGVANSLLGLALSEDDETDPTKKKYYTEINSWERAKSIIIPIPINGKYRKVSLGFMGLFAFGLGDQIVGYLSGNVKADEAATNVGTSLVSSFVPFWSGGAVDSITPWVLQPVIELWTNSNWLGNPIYPEKDTRMPQSSQAFEKTPEWAKSAAEFANYWSGGSHTEPGWVDVYPATLEYFSNFALQGLKSFGSSSYETFRSFMDGEAPEGDKMPFVRRVTTRDTAQRSDYYELRNSIKAGVAQARDLRKIIMDRKSTPEEKADARTTMRKLSRELGISLTTDGVTIKNSIADQFDKTDEKIKRFNEEIKAIQDNENLTTAEKAERVRQKEAAKEAAMNLARRRYLSRNRPEESPAEQIMDVLQ